MAPNSTISSIPLMPIRDKWFRLLVILLPCILTFYTSNINLQSSQSQIFRGLISIISIPLITEGVRLLSILSRKKFRGKLRLIYLSAAGLLWTSLILALSAILRTYIKTGSLDLALSIDSNIVLNNRRLVLNVPGYAFLYSLFIFPFLLAANEVLFHYAKLRFTAKEKEVLEKEKLKLELQQLKGIINPHFLFNNLNSLSSLIAESPQQAQDFLDELTKVFRYLLRNNDTELASLEQELKFIQSYYHLLQTRYGSAIGLVTELDPDTSHLLIPPLTLQLLVENAVKHNKVQKDQPLKIELRSLPGNKLLIRNNFRPRESGVESTGIGLQNINSRYQMLNQELPVVKKDADYFSVIISLIDCESALMS